MTPRRACALLILAAALLPSAWLAWTFRDLPHFGLYHDDALYLVSAKSWAEGSGHRILSLPGQPFQTKFPPLYPLLLGAVWKAAPSFPSNLPWAMLTQWLLLPALMAASWFLWRGAGLSPARALILLIFLALNPICVFFSTILMSELLFTALLVLSVTLAERGRPFWSGVFGGLAFLTRTAGMPLLATSAAVFALRRHWRAALCFAASMGPFVAAWQAWVALSRTPSTDLFWLYYTDYPGYYRALTSLAALPERTWLHIADAVKGIGELLVFNDDSGMLVTALARLLFAGSVIGLVRALKRGRYAHYTAFAALYLIQLALMHYPPNSRMVLPLLPLVLVGLLDEAERLGRAVGRSLSCPPLGNRIAAAGFAVALSALALYATSRTVEGTGSFLPKLYAHYRETLNATRPAYDWLASQPPGTVLAYADPVVYLYSGHQAISLRVPPPVMLSGDRAEMARFFEQVPQALRRYGVHTILESPLDYKIDAPELTRPAWHDAIARHPKAWASPATAIYAAAR